MANMTVAKLIAELSVMPEDMVVLVERGKGDAAQIFEIETVAFHKTDEENQVVVLEVR